MTFTTTSFDINITIPRYFCFYEHFRRYLAELRHIVGYSPDSFFIVLSRFGKYGSGGRKRKLFAERANLLP